MMHREPCGCAHNGRAWVKWCDAHALEFRERHERAQKEKACADVVGWYSAGPNDPGLVPTAHNQESVR